MRPAQICSACAGAHVALLRADIEIDDELYRLLQDFRGFRHVFRNAYSCLREQTRRVKARDSTDYLRTVGNTAVLDEPQGKLDLASNASEKKPTRGHSRNHSNQIGGQCRGQRMANPPDPHGAEIDREHVEGGFGRSL
ncbi:hypothetical protein BDD21_3322 [Thiocapsa rosea]|uniref:Uncharacterized protein n=1 Tax=Thiocapsa rosea TaxID=69360 RepID=A0A495VAR7_9GAMM|nr:hypothetical protein BDD21_3322 [Thiocapsa rosea]